MRYQSWDALVFPAGSKIPIQEFKTGCHVIQDHESGSLIPNTLMLPTVTCFIPGLQAGFPFRISVHSWTSPEISRYTQNYSKHPENVMFEARIFIDGKLSGRRLFQRTGPWPMIIDTGLDRDRNGDLEELRFPNFHTELLTQQFWNAGDDLGRIKIIISEGFPRDSLTMPLERVKNIVAFSFQHAPIEILEDSGIAWPNPTMWRQLPFNSAYLAQQDTPQKPYEDPESHSHSPRRKSAHSQIALSASSYPIIRPRAPVIAAFPRGSDHDPFYIGIGYRKASSTTSGDISMPDYGSHQLSHSNSGHINNTRHVTNSSLHEEHDMKQRRNLQSAGAYEQVYEALLPSAPANTPLDSATPLAPVKTARLSSQMVSEAMEDAPDIDPTLREPLFNEEFKGGKENKPDSPRPIENPFAHSDDTSRKGSLPFNTTNDSGSKRQRIAEPSFCSPTPRKVSSALSGISNIL